MEQTWRWFGPEDKVTLRDAKQAGAAGIVTALHHLPPGSVWSIEDIRHRQDEIAAAGLRWSVVESLDVTEVIKLRAPGWQKDVAAFIQSLRNLSACGLRTVAYNLMPIFSWMRTSLHAPLPNGGFTTRFDAVAFAAFDLYILQREEGEGDWGEKNCIAAREYHDALSPEEQYCLQTTILNGLAGGNGSLTLQQVRTLIRAYSEIDEVAFRANAGEFLRAVCPVAQESGIQLCIHPDDPPRSLLGLPRIVSTADDLEWLLQQSPEESNGITFCTGALGVRKDNDLLAMVRRFAPRIGFAHLRSTQRERDENVFRSVPIESFFEAAHLEGDADLVGIIVELVKEERRRTHEGGVQPLLFRPDHGQELLNDSERGAQAAYPAIGRLRGLAELRGVMLATERLLPEAKA
jgi:mannonate dehydratase